MNRLRITRLMRRYGISESQARMFDELHFMGVQHV